MSRRPKAVTIENRNRRDPRVFSKYNFDIITIIGIFLMLYVVGGISGWLYEMGFYRINFGYFVRRGHGIGPWLPIYGFGTLFILICTFLVREKPLYVFLVSAAVTGILELVTGWCLYHFFNGLRLWDYNTEIWNWGNIGGYVCFRSVAVFAFAGLLVVYVVFPLVCGLAENLPRLAFLVVSWIPGLLFLMDYIYGYWVKGL